MKRWQYSMIVSGVIVALAYIFALCKVGQVPDTPELITCEERYVGDTYWGEVKLRDGDYIYLDGYHSIDTICAIDKSQVEEGFPLCGTQVEFKGPLDISNMNCYEEGNIKSELKAFKERMEDEKKEDEKYFTCNVDSKKMVEIYNSCSEFECARYRMSEYFKEVCPRANIN